MPLTLASCTQTGVYSVKHLTPRYLYVTPFALLVDILINNVPLKDKLLFLGKCLAPLINDKLRNTTRRVFQVTAINQYLEESV
ncbi:MAG: hypothetical protein WDM80_16910 [Limisphaerales bacterium]